MALSPVAPMQSSLSHVPWLVFSFHGSSARLQCAFVLHPHALTLLISLSLPIFPRTGFLPLCVGPFLSFVPRPCHPSTCLDQLTVAVPLLNHACIRISPSQISFSFGHEKTSTINQTIYATRILGYERRYWDERTDGRIDTDIDIGSLELYCYLVKCIRESFLAFQLMPSTS